MIALLLSLALADVAPPDAEDCYGKKVGDPCKLNGTRGACVEATRYRATPDGEVESSYLACRVDEKQPSTSRCQTAPGWPWLALLLLPLVRRR